jgi:hypothetical protein
MSVTMKLEVHDDAKVLTAENPAAPRAEFDVDVTVRNHGPGECRLAQDDFEFELYDGPTRLDGLTVEPARIEHEHLGRGEEGTLHAHLEVPDGRVRPNTPYFLICNAHGDRAKMEFRFL